MTSSAIKTATTPKPFFANQIPNGKKAEPAKNEGSPPPVNTGPNDLKLSDPISLKDKVKDQDKVAANALKANTFKSSTPQGDLTKITKPISGSPAAGTLKPEKAKVEIKTPEKGHAALKDALATYTKAVTIDGQPAGYSVDNKTWNKAPQETQKMLLDHFKKQDLVRIYRGDKTYYIKPAYEKAVQDAK